MCFGAGPGYWGWGGTFQFEDFFFILRYTLLKIHSFRMHAYMCFDNYTHHVIILPQDTLHIPLTEKKIPLLIPPC